MDFCKLILNQTCMNSSNNNLLNLVYIKKKIITRKTFFFEKLDIYFGYKKKFNTEYAQMYINTCKYSCPCVIFHKC